MFFIPFIVNLCSLYYVIRGDDRKRYIVNTMAYDVLYLLLFTGMYFMIFAINGFEKGTNHYDSQFSGLFPITVNTIVWGAIGCIVYWSFLIVNSGIFPIPFLVHKWKAGNRSWMVSFLLTAAVFLTIEIVFMIVLTEQGTGTLPNKFLFRYFQIFVPIMLVLFLKDKEDVAFLKSFAIRNQILLCLGVITFYFAYMGATTRQSIMDGHAFLFLEKVTEFILPKFNLLASFLLALFVLWAYWGKTEKSKVMEILTRWGVAAVIFFDLLEFGQLLYYTNVVADGQAIQSDSIKIADYLNKEQYNQVYYVEDLSKSPYLEDFHGYLKQPHQIIGEAEAATIIENLAPGNRVAFLAPGKLSDSGLLVEVDIGTTRYTVLKLPSSK